MIFEKLVAISTEAGDHAASAGFAVNLAAAEVELGELHSAAARLGKTLELCRRHRLEGDALHARWILATIPLHSGRPGEAAEQLKKVLDDCRARHMTGTAVGVALDLAEACTLIPRPADVVRICTTIIEDFIATRRLAAACLLAVIFNTGDALALTRDSSRERSWVESIQVWIAKRLPRIVVAFGEKLTIPPGGSGLGSDPRIISRLGFPVTAG